MVWKTVVGNAGLGPALLILLLANGISVLTSVSLSAIATNLKIKGGGDYYVISRTLGHEFGGALGIVLFLAQSVSIAFYCLGFGEAATGLISTDLTILPQIIAALAVSFIFIFAWLGADWAAKFQYLVMIVLYAAILSFFIGGFLRWDTGLLVQNWTASRILQSLATDRIFPFLNFFVKGSGPASNPRRGVLLSAGIAYATVAYGHLNLIAPVVSMFFLTSYGLLNYATYYEARSQSPSFRPRFRYFNEWLSLAGALACLGAVLAVDPTAGVVAVTVLFGIFQYVKRTAGPSRWADSRRSYHLQPTREHLLAASAEPEHPRYWRPQILAFSDNQHRRTQLLRFSSWIEGGSGLTTAVRILEGKDLKMRRQKESAEARLRKDIQECNARAFPLVVVAQSLQIGIETLVQAYGVGSLKANTILLNWLGHSPAELLGLQGKDFGKNLRAARLYGRNIVILDAKEDKWKALEQADVNQRQIDVWWWNDATGRLMLLLANLTTRHEKWNNSRIRLLAAARNAETDQTVESLKEMLEDFRIEATPEIVKDAEADTLAEYSADSSLVFLPFRIRDDRVVDPFGNSMGETLFLLPVTALVMAAEDIDLDAEPEEGEAGEMAEAMDTREEAAKQADKMARKAAKAAAKAEAASREAESSGVMPEKPEKEKI